MPETPPTEVAVVETRFPCDTCGSDLRFDPGSQDLSCEYCGNRQSIDASKFELLSESSFDEALAESDTTTVELTRIAGCSNCGAEISFDPDTDALECPFCATPLVIESATSKQIRPSGVLPFFLDEPHARDAMTQWLGQLWFAPSRLQEFARKGRRLEGVYVPYWTYDANTRTRYSGQRGTIYYETRSFMKDGKRQTRRVAKTRWRSVSGRVARVFDDVLVLGSRSLPQDHTDKLTPWDLSSLTPFDPQYLAGFRAESYTIDIKEGFLTARTFMDRMIARDIKFDIGGDKQRITSADTIVKDVSYKHVLLPIWIAAYKYRGKSYRFVVNGQTGKVSGARPYSAFKIAFAVLLGALLAAAIGFLIASNQ